MSEAFEHKLPVFCNLSRMETWDLLNKQWNLVIGRTSGLEGKLSSGKPRPRLECVYVCVCPNIQQMYLRNFMLFQQEI
jgi:hypothetical protein